MASKHLSATIKIGGAIAGSFRSMIGQTRMQLGAVGNSIDVLKTRQRDLNSVVREQEKLGAHASALKIGYAQQELGAINKQIEALRKKQQIENTNAENRAKYGALAIGRTMAAVGIGTIAVKALGVLVKESSEFNHKLQLIGNTADMTGQQIAGLKQEIISASQASGRSLEQVTDGLGFLVAAGMDVATASKSIKVLAQAATATGANIEDLAKATFTLNDSLKIDPEKLKQALDTLAQAGKEGNVELRDMAKVLPTLGASFVALKMEGREAAATMGAALEIARKGAANADEAANNLQNTLVKLMSPETLKKAKKHFGLDLYQVIKDAQTKGENPFEASMQAIIKATKGDQKAIGELFQDMQVQAFLRPLTQGWEEYKRIKDKALNADGVIDRDFARMADTAKEKMDAMGSAWKRLKASMGEGAEPIFGGMSVEIGKALDSATKFTNEHPKLVGSLAAITTAALGTATAVLAIGAAVAALKFAMSAGGLAGLAGVATVGAVLAGVGVGGYAVFKNWDAIKSFFTGKEEPPKDQQDQPGGPPKQVLQIPPMRSGGSNVTNNVSAPVNLNITQLPGQDSKALADEVIRRMREQQAVRGRSIMFDKPMGY